ncbi:MAG: penicillin-binding protein 2 [Opitutaceae bacterium]|nr:penicillin-binding protein 2 [Opitutaceae bacterium]
MSKGFASNYRIVLLATVCFGCFAAVAARLVWLQIVEREKLVATIAKTRQSATPIPEIARRGDILDARGGVLATSSPRLAVGLDPWALLKRDEPKWPQLAALLKITEADIAAAARRRFRDEPKVTRAPVVKTDSATGRLIINLTPPVVAEDDDDDDSTDTPEESGRKQVRWVVLAKDVSEQTYADIVKLGLKGVRGERAYRRVYPNNQLAAHLLGYVNRQQDAAAGVEAQYDFYLRGQQGWRVSERDGRGGELPQFLTRRVAPAHGYHVQLSIDLIVQDIVEQELAHIGEKFRPAKASIIVSDPQTGFILGLGNYPTFDLNAYNKVPAEEMARMKNVAVADTYEPGSVFKIVPAAAALEERLVTAGRVFDCTVERIVNRGTNVSMPAEDHRMGDLTVAEIISRSSNKGAAQLGLLVGEEKLHDYARAFGFGRKLGFPVGGEVAGTLHHWKKWYPIDITRITMGHSVASTVLQMHQAMSVIAADGVLLRPQLVRQIRDSSNDVVLRYDRTEIGRAVSPDTARIVAEMLVGVTRKGDGLKPGGTAPEAAIEGFDVAGKTGTSQKLIDGAYSKKHHVASFVGFFPAGRPQVVISVVVDDADHMAPGGVAYGAKVAAPSFKRIAERLIPILNIQSASRSGPPRLLAAQAGGRR